METVNSVVNQASRAIFGDRASSQEPVSGVTGDTAKGEPYDAGNIEENTSSTTAKTATAGATSTTPHANPTTTTSTTETTHAPSTTNTTSNPVGDGASSSETQQPKDAAPHASELKDSSVHTGDHSKGQNDTRDPTDPSTNPEKKENQAKQEVDDSGSGPDKNENPVKVDGPGPKPISEIAKQYGGDAGNAPSSGSVDKQGKEGESDKAEGAQKPGESEEEDGPQKVSHGEGTGEKYVKSSGLKAEGGDFDAAAPGAGREADRLLEEKGVHREENGLDKPVETEDSKHGKEKVSLKDKIKAKLHKNSSS